MSLVKRRVTTDLKTGLVIEDLNLEAWMRTPGVGLYRPLPSGVTDIGTAFHWKPREPEGETERDLRTSGGDAELLP